MNVLVVVDMQPGHESTRHGGVLEAVAAEVREARRLGMPIIFLEHVGYGSTYESILALVAGYDLFDRLRKTRWSGADVALKLCRERGWQLNRFRVCGVNTFECVAETVEELTVLSPASRIDVVREACNDKVIGWGLFPVHPNIVVAPLAASA